MMENSSASDKMKLGAIENENTALFICDLQEKFAPAIAHFSSIVDNTQKLLNGCKLMNIPVVATEQYPKGLGKTVSELNLTDCTVIPKTLFNMIVPEVDELLRTLCEGKLKSIVLLGIEAHICVEQSAIDLVSRGYTVHIVADCTSSRTQEDRMLAFQRLRQIGCYISTSECILFKLLKSKDHHNFKDIATLVKPTSKLSGLSSL